MDQRTIYQNDEGGVAVIIPSDCGLTIEQIAAKDVPTGVPYEIVDVADVPTDRTFRNAWVMDRKAVAVDVEKAKGIAHTMRRDNRAAELAPLDIQATIPDRAVAAEEKRQLVRAKDAKLQADIDASKDVGDLKRLLGT